MMKIHNMEWWPIVIVVRSATVAKKIVRTAMMMMTITAKVVKVVGSVMAVKTIMAKLGRLAKAAKIIAQHEMSSNVVCR